MSLVGQTSPRTKTIGLRQRAWWVMRRCVSFTLPELLATLADGSERDAINNLGKYVRALERQGSSPGKASASQALRLPATARCAIGW